MHRRANIALPPVSRSTIALILAGVSLAACAGGPRYDTRASGPGLQPRADAGARKVGKPYQVRGVWYTPAEQPDYDQVGVGSWYGEQFHNRQTANGEVFDMDLKTAAHTTLPLPSLVEVTNLDNGRKMVVRVNDRGPFVDNRIIDLSRSAARELGYENQGLARVRVRYIGPAPLLATEPRTYQASAPRPPKPPLAAKWDEAASPAAYGAPGAKPDYLPGGPIRTPGVTMAALPPITPYSPPAYQPSYAAPPYSPPAYSAAGSAYRIQAGAFSDRARAEQAAQALSGTGRPEIIPVERDGSVLYRVQVTGQGQAWAVRDQVASLGYADAKVIEGF